MDNSAIQIINSERAVGTIISNFSTDFIMDVIQDTIKMKFRPFGVGTANFVIVLEQQFNVALMQNPAYRDRIIDVRSKTYKEIIDMICKSYNLSYIGDEVESYNSDQLYNLAMMLFDIFVTNFTPRMINFFVQYIINNKDDIYRSIENADEIRKNKEATAYGKKLYVDPKLVVIHSDLNNVLSGIAAHDIPFPKLMSYLADANTSNYIVSLLQDNNDMYKYYYASYILDPVTRPDLFTSIKFSIQSLAAEKPVGIDQYSTEQ